MADSFSAGKARCFSDLDTSWPLVVTGVIQHLTGYWYVQIAYFDVTLPWLRLSMTAVFHFSVLLRSLVFSNVLAAPSIECNDVNSRTAVFDGEDQVQVTLHSCNKNSKRQQD